VEQATGQTYTLAELAAEIARRLAASGVEPASGRVSAVPDGRTLRYYTTIGLLDRPIEVRDRQARYGERHVLQALSVKSLQASGHNLGTIQAALAGLDDAQLRALVAAGSRGELDVARRRFWAVPAAQDSHARDGAGRDGAAQESAAASAPVTAAPADRPNGAVVAPPLPPEPARSSETCPTAITPSDAELQTSLRLAPGCSLVLSGEWTTDKVEVLRRAALPLVEAWAALAGAPSHCAPHCAPHGAPHDALTAATPSTTAAMPAAARPDPNKELP
jgi:DNA-binding transcriptional MerR regulator